MVASFTQLCRNHIYLKVYASSLTSRQGCLGNTGSGLLVAHCLYSLSVGYINTVLFILNLMNRRFNIPITKRRCVVRALGRRNRVYPRVNHDSPRDDAFNLETECVLETMRNMTPEEAVSYSAQAVAEAEVAMLAAEEAMREAEAAEAEAQAATEAFEKMKAEARKRSRKTSG
ncbi:uncharacterized protein LOC125213753 isoform X2 [Salvia hispanica]|uniref:uncharacterized protein LOC125213753 isoform X2 n=1 Tax=Salvia hispanica TaxID=49212 RepID=UPI0020091513|nr:uncharacterized protein LOC125213753 isoform X2 [Salvia hispanica]XP_047970430.1 uncharacterized protein LOC125213753 isoform X2 [Salvia hispanica]XP_047970431.1 uncharacterized protein LOC125213753 isoform X2 [Salvia hispanica]